MKTPTGSLTLPKNKKGEVKLRFSPDATVRKWQKEMIPYLRERIRVLGATPAEPELWEDDAAMYVHSLIGQCNAAALAAGKKGVSA